MRRNLNEQIHRMKNLAYGDKPFLNENTVGVSSNQQAKDNIISFLSNYKNNGLSLPWTYSEDTKKLQQALILLGYKLGKYGADGYYGSVTSRALRDLIKKQGILNEDASFLRNTLNSLDYYEKGNEIDNGGPIRDELSAISAEILRKYKKVRPKVKVRVSGGNDKYHHSIKNYASAHTRGLALDFTFIPYSKDAKNAFLQVLADVKIKYPKLSYLDEYSRASRRSTGGHIHIQLNIPNTPILTHNDEQTSQQKLNKAITNGNYKTKIKTVSNNKISKPAISPVVAKKNNGSKGLHINSNVINTLINALNNIA
jgi:peptidoglycan hydrolase-like protein with peptidoglycan-binding domain